MKPAVSLLSLLPWGSSNPESSNAATRNEGCTYNKIAPDRMVSDQYRVLFRDHHTLEDHFENIGQNLSETAESFTHVPCINGYRARLSPEVLHELVRQDPGVEIVEHNTYRGAPDPIEPREPTQRVEYKGVTKRWTESTGWRPWFLRMINSGRKEELDSGTDVKDTWYTEAGQGVNIYVLDGGVRLSHEDFGGRAKNFGDGETSPYTRTTWNDERGHGTHIAGVAAVVAPAASIINVKVVDDDVTVDDTIQALNDVVADHRQQIRNKNYHGSVINMSMGEENTDGLRRVIASAIAEGITVVTSAGNRDEPEGTVPCGYPQVICVAACNSDYKKWSGSNYGKDVTIVAPGQDILSADYRDDHDRFTLSGTSEAAAFVSGVTSHYVGYERIRKDVVMVQDRLASNMVFGALTGFLTRRNPTVNYLVNTGFNSIGKLPSFPYFIPFHRDVVADAKTNEEAKAAANAVAAAAAAAATGASTTFNITTSIETTAVAAPSDASVYPTVGTANFTLPASLATPLTLNVTTSSAPTAIP